MPTSPSPVVPAPRMRSPARMAAAPPVAFWAACLLIASLAPALRSQSFQFITEGISPGLVYAFEGGTGGDARIHDHHQAWFVNETAHSSLLDMAFSKTYPEFRLVEYGLGAHYFDPQTSFREERQTFHVMARSYASGALVVDGESFTARQLWGFEVTDPEHPESRAQHQATISGRLWMSGYLSVFGAGSAGVEARVTVRRRALQPDAYLVGAPVVSRVIASYAIDHANDLAVAGSLGGDVGLPFDGIAVGLAASRSAHNERIRLNREFVDFSLPLQVTVSEGYELEVSFSGHAENRGLPWNVSQVWFATDDEGFGTQAQLVGQSLHLSESDPSHLLNTVDFFQLELPNVPFGNPFQGTEKWKFPKIGEIFDGHLITMNNGFKMEPMGPIHSVEDALAILGASPNLGAKLAGSGGDGSPSLALGLSPEEVSGGVWIGDLVITVASR